MPHRRSMSRDRGSSEGRASTASSYRSWRERSQPDIDPGYHARSSKQDLNSRSMSLLRTSSFAADNHQDREPSMSAEEGEEKPEQRQKNICKKAAESITPSETGSLDRDLMSRTEARRPNLLEASALPPRPYTSRHTSVRFEMKSLRMEESRDLVNCEGVDESSITIKDNVDTQKLAHSRINSNKGVECKRSREEELNRRTSCAVINDPTKREVIPLLADKCSVTTEALAHNSEVCGFDKTAATSAVHADMEGIKVKKTEDIELKDDAKSNTESDATSPSIMMSTVEIGDSKDNRPKAHVLSVKTQGIDDVETVVLEENSLSVTKQESCSSDINFNVCNKPNNLSIREELDLPFIADENTSQMKKWPQLARKITDDKDGIDQIESATQSDAAAVSPASNCLRKANDLIQRERDDMLAANVKMVAIERGHDDSSRTTNTADLISKQTSNVVCIDGENEEVEEGEMVTGSITANTEGTMHGFICKKEEGQTDDNFHASFDDVQERNRPQDTRGVNFSQTVYMRSKLKRSRTDPLSIVSDGFSKPRSTSFSSIKSSNVDRFGESKDTIQTEPKYTPNKLHGQSQKFSPKQQGELSLPVSKTSLSLSEHSESDQLLSLKSQHGVDASGYACESKSSRTIVSTSFRTHILESDKYSAIGRQRLCKDKTISDNCLTKKLIDTSAQPSIQLTERAEASRDIITNGFNCLDCGARKSQLQEEPPALPNIPLPSAKIDKNTSSDARGDAILTKRHRPRLGWGQGLIVQNSPTQSAKRPRIGWGQGLMQQKDDVWNESDKTSVAALKRPDDSNAITVEDESIVGASVCLAVRGEGATAMSDVDSSSVGCESQIGLMLKLRDEKHFEESTAKQFMTEVFKKADKQKTQDVCDVQEVITSTKPSKEEILSSIDVLDSDITNVKKQLKALQRIIAVANIEQKLSIEPDSDIILESLDSSTPNSGLNSVSTSLKSKISSPESIAPFQTKESLVKAAVDSEFVEMLAGIFSDNLVKITAANGQLPKRIEDGHLATKIYHQPSDYAFYQNNLNRGSALANQVRLKVRMRNRARHVFFKKLARDYVDLKKSWKLGVKKMEKDRKRLDKYRHKQLQKQKLNSASDCGPIRTTNTSHQSPHVQQLVAAEKAAEAACESTTVRTSSRLTNNSSADLENNDLEKVEHAKAQAILDQEVRKKRLKNALSTIIPDMLISSLERHQRYFYRSVNGQSCMADGLVVDWKLKEKAEMKINPWNDLEKCIYVDKFLQYPKNFSRISSYLSNKTTGDVIAFYYRTKRVADYKALLREQQLRRRGAGSKNTWSCWNLSACAAIRLGVQFPEVVAKLLLHPSNFRSHQASDNILNSFGAQRVLRGLDTKSVAGRSIKRTIGIAEGKSAIDLVSGPDHTSCIRQLASELGLQLEDSTSSGDFDSLDETKFNLYTQQLKQFVAGQQRPFLVDYASLLSDNSYSTGYEVLTISTEERLKKYPDSSTEVETAIDVVKDSNSDGQLVDSTKGKQWSQAVGLGAYLEKGGINMTKKEPKQQRKPKKLQEGAAELAGAIIPMSGQDSIQLSGNVGGEKSLGHNRKKGNSGTSTPNISASNRSSPRISIPGDLQAGKKLNRGGGGTPVSRRNNHQAPLIASHAPPNALLNSAGMSMSVSTTAPGTGPVPKSVCGKMTPQVSAKAISPSATVEASSGSLNAAPPAKRVVQKWTEGEKAGFLTYFSQFGKDWSTLTEKIPTKTAAQIKNYYQNYKNRLNLQDILKRRIECAAASGGSTSGTAIADMASGNGSVSPRSAAAGLMSGSLRQMGQSVDFHVNISTGMTNKSVAINSTDPIMSYQVALTAAQPGLHGVSMLPEIPVNQYGVRPHQDQQQSHEIMHSVSNSERYLKLLNMQHQLQLMQLQQQQKSQGVPTEVTNNSSYHESQMNTAQQLYHFSRLQQQPQVPSQYVSVQALQQMGLQSHTQTCEHSQIMQLSNQHQQQARASYGEVRNSNNIYQTMPNQQVMGNAAKMSPMHAQQYDSQLDFSSNDGTDGGAVVAKSNVGIDSNQMGCHDMAQHSIINTTMTNNATSDKGNLTPQGITTKNPHQPPLAPSRLVSMDATKQGDAISRLSTWSSTSDTIISEDVSSNNATQTAIENGRKGCAALVPPAPPLIQPMRSRMSFSSILNESESPRDDLTPRGQGSMVVCQQESPHQPPMQQQMQQQMQQHMQQQMHKQIQQQRQLRVDHALLVRLPIYCLGDLLLRMAA
ncbi:Nuclear receptor coregulator SMRT/SMRTER, contains Myb-like domains [Plasmopara halstedii]|uniref:Nuclear receptor coregulator SMRT/SMRTER, contains Myb-like domains n=1 Tax=Plasmopara halstedii TaxID=4781 RepID=A0A0P1ANG1_PLAHL|nr:Nuclear receptor coregulator SMRT/SMRTER, contains Myb-like domains [Plasmopara halstedii]CEG42250.1 Nuclear receptor coregulator SMRT/SMRTER, contains Myb-like domains [Plasmopara halstedii]|eukprot:XP_024578619.1 Nuclear receptor coregulator SMRT/SMRTER, contains Myb-like domains [Plasmopara halstedii]